MIKFPTALEFNIASEKKGFGWKTGFLLGWDTTILEIVWGDQSIAMTNLT